MSLPEAQRTQPETLELSDLPVLLCSGTWGALELVSLSQARSIALHKTSHASELSWSLHLFTGAMLRKRHGQLPTQNLSQILSET